MAIDLQDLRWMIVMARHRSLRRAAEELNVRESTLSRRLKNLDQRIGAPLFERTVVGTRPTGVGKEFLVVARRILEDSDTAFGRLRTRALGQSGQLTIGIYTSLAAGNLRATLTEHRERFPHVDIRSVDGHRDYLFGDLAAGMIDVIIMTSSFVDWDDCTLPLWSERVIIALPEKHPLCALPVIHWNDLENERLLLPERDPAPEFEHLLATKLGSTALVRALPHGTGLDRLLSYVGIGYGPLLILEGATGARYKGVTYREVHDEEGPTRVDFAAYWRSDNANPALRPFLNILHARYPDLSDDSVSN